MKQSLLNCAHKVLPVVIQKILDIKGNIVKIEFTVDGNSFEAFVPDDQMFMAIKDILLNREYEQISDFDLINFKNKRIIDAGAHVGLFSMVASPFAKEIIALEPHPINYMLLRMNIIKNNIKNVVIMNKALTSKEDTMKLYETKCSSSHTFFPSSDKYYEVTTTNVERIVKDFGDVDLLKLDIEGSEFEVFERLDSKILKNIKFIVGEMHLSKGDLNSVLRPLKENNFKTQLFSCPPVERQHPYKIKTKNLTRLKILKKLIYTASSLANIKEDNLVILFAKNMDWKK